MGITFWFTGISGSGKSTLADGLALNMDGYRLDGDSLREGLNSDLGFSKEDRKENVRRAGEVASLFAESGRMVSASFISPFEEDREEVRRIHERKGVGFVEIHVDCSLEEAEKRDPKGLYKKVRAGLIPNFTGISSDYEPPIYPDIYISTVDQSVQETIDHLVEVIGAIFKT